MEDADSESDAEMADSSRTRPWGPRDGLFGRCRPKRHSGIGNRIPRFPVLGGGDFPIPDSRLAGNRETGIGPFPNLAGTGPGNRGPVGRHAGDFLVWTHGFNLNLKRRRHSDFKLFLYNFPPSRDTNRGAPCYTTEQRIEYGHRDRLTWLPVTTGTVGKSLSARSVSDVPWRGARAGTVTGSHGVLQKETDRAQPPARRGTALCK